MTVPGGVGRRSVPGVYRARVVHPGYMVPSRWSAAPLSAWSTGCRVYRRNSLGSDFFLGLGREAWRVFWPGSVKKKGRFSSGGKSE